MKTITLYVCGIICLGAWSVRADNPVKKDASLEMLSSVPAAELPLNVVDAIKKTKASNRTAMTIKIVKKAVEINPAAAPAIVGAVARALPEMAAVAAGSAAEQQPKQAAIIARAASAAAPTKAAKIVAAVCRAVPGEFKNIAIAVAQTVPDAGKEILEAVGNALPNLKPLIAQVLAASPSDATSVAEVLNQLKSVAPSQTASYPAANPAMVRSTLGPAILGPPPAIPLSGTPGDGNPGNSGGVPTGGRGYATP